jgi:hypothetical protein
MIIIRRQILFFYIKKAFDTIDFAVLLDNLENIKICEIAPNLCDCIYLKEVLKSKLAKNHIIFSH